MADEARIHVSTGFSGGISVNIRANNAAELEQIVADAVANSPTLARLMQQTGVTLATEQGAIQNVQQVFPAAQVAPQSTVGQPLPQPTVVQQPTVQQSAQQQQRIPGPAGAPPGVVYPGPCAHGDRVYVDKAARGKPWRRWECNVPWSRNAHGRCDAINVEG